MADRINRLDLLTDLCGLDQLALHLVLCELIPDDVRARRAAVQASHALELRHPVVDDWGHIHRTRPKGSHGTPWTRHRGPPCPR